MPSSSRGSDPRFGSPFRSSTAGRTLLVRIDAPKRAPATAGLQGSVTSSTVVSVPFRRRFLVSVPSPAEAASRVVSRSQRVTRRHPKVTRSHERATAVGSVSACAFGYLVLRGVPLGGGAPSHH